MPRRPFRLATSVSQRGLSLVELMVGIAVGLFIVAGASVVVTTQLSDNRRLLLETQVQQDLRATADIITRELRRAGFVENAEDHVWRPAGPTWPAGSASSAHANVTVNADLDAVGFEYERLANPGPWGFKRVTRSIGGVERGVIQTRLGISTDWWQDLTDIHALDVTSFRVSASIVAETLPCARTCPTPPGPVTPPDTPENWCWPTLAVRTYEIEITARAASDANVQRSIRSTARLRNDSLEFDPSMPANQACP